MTKFAYITDIHVREKASKRLDNGILEVFLNKLQYINDNVDRLGIDVLVCGGDLGHSFDWKMSTFWKVYNAITNLKCPFYSIIGNHDVPGRNVGEYKDTAIGMLEDLGAITILHPNKPHRLGDIQFWGFHSDVQETENLVKGRYIKDAQLIEKNCLQVAIVHASVGEDSTPWQIGHKTLCISGFDYALFGDIHTGFKPHKLVTGCVVANPGCFIRQKIDEAPVIPSFYLISKKGLETYHLPHNPSNDIFDFDSAEKLEQIISGKDFVERLDEAVKSKNRNPVEFISELGEKYKYSRQSIDLLREEIKK